MSPLAFRFSLAAVAAVLALGVAGPDAAHEGREVRLRDGRRWVVLAPDPHVPEAWQVRVGRTRAGDPVILTVDADDLADAIAGDYPADPR